LAASLLNAAVLLWNVWRLAATEQRVVHTHEVVVGLERLLMLLTEAETSQRGYLLTNQDVYLGPYRQAIQLVDGSPRVLHLLNKLQTLTADNPRQQEHFPALRKHVNSKLNELAETLRLHDNPGTRAEALKVVRSGRGRQAMIDTHDLVDAMRAEEERLLARRNRDTNTSLWVAYLCLGVGAVLVTGLVLLTGYLIQRERALRKRASDDLAEQAERFRVTLASIGDGVIVTGSDGAVTFLNPVAEELTGWPAAQAAQVPLTEVFRIVNEQTRRPVENPVARVLREGVVVGLANHTVLIGRDGVERPIEDSGAPIRDARGTIVGVVLVFRDATDKRRAELARAHLAAIVESSDLAIVSKALDGTILSWNVAAEHLFGYSAAEAVGRPISMLAPPDRPDEQSAILQRLHLGESIQHYETVRIRKDGTLVPVSVSVSPIRDPAGEVVAAAAIKRDISERRRGEEALRASNDLLREANQRKDEFLALLGHELRNPLAPLRNAVQLLRLRPGDPNVVAQAREMIDRQTTQLTRLVDELLDASRIARGKVTLKADRVDLAEMAGAAAEDHRAELEAAGLGLTVEVAAGPVWVRGDAARLMQVMGNLLHNSLKFTAPGGRVTLRLTEERGRAALTVADTGIGISPEVLPRLFESFSQADATLERSKGGLGLGLTVVKGLVELHGGEVGAASAGLGLGAAFTVHLPLDHEEPEPPERAAAPAAPVAPGRRGRVLIVEDGRDTAESLRMLLSMHGFEVEVALTGPEGLQKARAFHPDAVICDLGLPGMSGYEVARALRADPTLAGTLLVCVSGYGQEEDKRKARAAGFEHMLVKPADSGELLRLLARGRG
jgi:PAS domain S-box-containing protein